MIKKTMTITSIAVLIAAVSFATSITMVQADPEPTSKATFGLAPLGGANPLAGGDLTNHEYSHVAASKPLTIPFTNPASLPGGFFDAVEPGFQGAPFIAPAPDASITLHLAGVPVTTPFNIVEGYEEATFTMTSLNPGQNYFLGTTIFDMDDFGLTTDAAMLIPAPETVFVSVNGVDLSAPVTAVPGGGQTQGITTAHGVVKATPAGDIVVGFNEIFAWDPNTLAPIAFPPFAVCGNAGFPLPCIGLQSGIRVEQITVEQASQSHGFWKNHETETAALLPKTIGDLDVDTIEEAIAVLSAKGHGNAHNTLAIQLLAALLNDMNGSLCTFPATAATDAQTELALADYTGPDSTTKPTKAAKAAVNAIKDTLEDYNTNTVC